MLYLFFPFNSTAASLDSGMDLSFSMDHSTSMETNNTEEAIISMCPTTPTLSEFTSYGDIWLFSYAAACPSYYDFGITRLGWLKVHLHVAGLHNNGAQMLSLLNEV